MSKNPYIGPRAFKAGEELPAREREKRELTDLLIAERVVLLHSPSGAGKTSLIQAGVLPLLEEERVGEARFQPIPLRVKTLAPAGRLVHNRYVFSAVLDLVEHGLVPGSNFQDLASEEFPEVLRVITERLGNKILVLIFDQFEEILTLDPGDWHNQEVFFEELGRALSLGVWVLLSMREDYIGGLDRFVRYFPDRLRTTYRLDLLRETAAKAAIREPAVGQGVDFTSEAVDRLLRRLTIVRIQRPGTGVEETQRPYVLPFQLQVVCRKLWTSVAAKKGDGFKTIDVDDVRSYANVTDTLRDYYADTVRDIARKKGVDETLIRDWFEKQMITEQHSRNQTQTGPPVPGEGDSHDVLAALQDAYLVRGDTRSGETWYELTHSNLIEAILESNKTADLRWSAPPPRAEDSDL